MTFAPAITYVFGAETWVFEVFEANFEIALRE
jgi:hypothetical protein